MSDDGPPARRYGERESALILRRAVALQESSGRGAGRGLSLEDLRQIALEVGVDPAFVSEAAPGVGLGDGALAIPPSRRPSRHMGRRAGAVVPDLVGLGAAGCARPRTRSTA